MEITKEHLEKKLEIFKTQYEDVKSQLSNYTILMRKLEGAIESIRILLEDIKSTNVE